MPPPGKSPPYTYDDPRIIYDELCLFYDGPYDEQCLIDLVTPAQRRRIGVGSARRKPIQPPPAFLELEIVTCLKMVNDKKLEDGTCEVFRWKGELDKDLTVTSRRVTHSRTNRYVVGLLSDVNNPADSRNAQGELVSVTKPQRTIVTSKIEESVTSSKIIVSSAHNTVSVPRVTVKIGKKVTDSTYLVTSKKKE